MKFQFNRKTVVAIFAVVIAAMTVYGVKDTDKVKAVLDAAAQFVPEEVPVASPGADAGVAGTPSMTTPETVVKAPVEATDAGVK